MCEVEGLVGRRREEESEQGMEDWMLDAETINWTKINSKL